MPAQPHASIQPAATLLPAAPLAQTLTGKIILAVAASLFVSICAHISVHIPYTPVPFTLSDFAVVLVGLTLGPVVGFSALALYLLEGASGLPVFTPGGLGGVAQILGPTGGYLVAYPFAAALAGFLRRAFSRTPRFTFSLIAAIAASTLLMVSGVSWLATVLYLSPAAAFRFGALPFIPGQIVKVLSAAGIYTALARWHRS